MIKKEKIVKLISFIFIIIVIPTVLFSQPQKANAGWPVIDWFAAPNNVSQTITGAQTAGSTTVSAGANTVTAGTTTSTAASSGLVAIYDSQDLMIDVQRVGKEILRQALIAIGHQLLNQITQSTVNWINSGFHGSPLFVQNPSQFFGNIGEAEVKNIVNQVGYDARQPFGKSYALNLIQQYKNTSQMDMQSSLSKVINDPVLLNNYQNNFNTGGWNAFLVNTQYPQNNYWGYTMLVNGQTASKLTANGNNTSPNLIQKATSMLSQGNGFLSPTTCPSNPAYNTMSNEFDPPTFNYDTTPGHDDYDTDVPACIPDTTFNPDGTTTDTGKCLNQDAITLGQAKYDRNYSYAQNTWAQTNTCTDANNKSALKVTTPGAVVSSQITQALGLSGKAGTMDAALGNSISAILNAFMNHFLQEGLSGLSQAVQSIPSPDTWTYNGQSLSNTTTTPKNQLIVPTSVTVKLGNTTPTTISGGTPPYTIQILGNCLNNGQTSQTTQTNCQSPATWTKIASPDPSVATANIPIGSSTLSVTGVGGGQTSFVVQDSSSPVQTATIQVTTSLILDFNNPSALQTIYAGNQNSTNATLSGGEAPYSIKTEPDSTIALALINNNILVIAGVAPGTTTMVVQDSLGISINLKIAIGSESPMTIPPASTTSGSSTTITISGGTAPYTIVTQPNTSIALAYIAGNTLNISGVTQGTTSVTIQDSFSNSTNKPVTVPITIGASVSSIDLGAGTQNISVATGSATSLVLSGSSGSTNDTSAPLYSIQKQPDSTIATANISNVNLTITGIAPGTTSMVIQDPSANTVTINITITGTSNSSGQATTPLSIPGSISLLDNSSKAITISGGTAPYKVQTNPNSNVALAVLNNDNNTITIIGKAAGTTLVTVQDSSSGQAQSATINIIVTTAPAFSVSSQSASVAIGDSSTITISGGTAPYKVQTTPNSNVATQHFSSDNSIVVTGVAAGTTSMVITDASGASKTISITVAPTAPLGSCVYGSQTVQGISQADCAKIGGINWTAN